MLVCGLGFSVSIWLMKELTTTERTLVRMEVVRIKELKSKMILESHALDGFSIKPEFRNSTSI